MLIKTRKSFMFWDWSVNRPREMWLPQLLPSPNKGQLGSGHSWRGADAIGALGSEEEGKGDA